MIIIPLLKELDSVSFALRNFFLLEIFLFGKFFSLAKIRKMAKGQALGK
jgi:hypothetical protein